MNFPFGTNGKFIILGVPILIRVICVDLDEVAHNELPRQYSRCLHIQLFSSLVLKEFIKVVYASLRDSVSGAGCI